MFMLIKGRWSMLSKSRLSLNLERGDLVLRALRGWLEILDSSLDLFGADLIPLKS